MAIRLCRVNLLNTLRHDSAQPPLARVGLASFQEGQVTNIRSVHQHIHQYVWSTLLLLVQLCTYSDAHNYTPLTSVTILTGQLSQLFVSLHVS